MKKVLVIIAGLLALVVVGVGGMAALQPDVTHIERSVVVAATPADAFPFANDFGEWMKWNPWQALDPAQAVTFSDQKAGPGAWYEWKSDKVGHGKMTITSSVPNEKVADDLVFIEPMAARAAVTFTFTPEGASTRVTWSYDAANGAREKVMGVFVNMDKMLGADFDRGLAAMKPLAEDAASKRKAMEIQAAAAAAAAAASPAVAQSALDSVPPPAPLPRRAPPPWPRRAPPPWSRRAPPPWSRRAPPGSEAARSRRSSRYPPDAYAPPASGWNATPS
jgi:hypothetical protein